MMIRPAALEDADAVGQLWLQLVEYHRQLDERMPSAAPNGASRYANKIRESILMNPHSRMHVLVAEEEGQVVGYVMGMIVELTPEEFVGERAGLLADIFVLPAHRGSGIARALVNALKAWFRARDVQHFEWHVAARNTAGIAFWRAMQGEDFILRMRASTQS